MACRATYDDNDSDDDDFALALLVVVEIVDSRLGSATVYISVMPTLVPRQ